jgi:multiple sugar transport system substrate-binding protein
MFMNGFRARIARLVCSAVAAAAIGAQETRITFMYWGSAAEDGLIRKSLAAFEAANPGVKVTPLYGVFSGTDYDAKIRAMAESGSLPDVSYFTAGELFYKYAAAGRFLDLTPYVDRERLRDRYLPQTWMSLGGRVYGILTAAECQLVYYNRDVLAAAKIAPPPADYRRAWTWDQYLDVWRKATIDAGGKNPGDPGFDPRRIVRFGVTYETWSQMLFPGIWGSGGDLFSADGRDILADRPEFIDFIGKLADLRNKRLVMSAPGLTAYNSPAKDDPKALLKEGKIAFYVSGTWELLDFKDMGFPLGVAALPRLKDPAQVYISGVNVVFAGTKHPDAAWKLQRWLMDTEKNLAFYADGLWMPTEKSWYEEPNLSRWTAGPAHPKGFVDAAVRAMDIARFHDFRQKNEDQIWAQYLNPALDRIWKGLDGADEGLARAAAKVRNSGLLTGVW